MDHIKAAADKGAPILVALLCEARSVEGTAEWRAWGERDPDAAEQAAVLLGEVLKEACGDRNWVRATETAARESALLKDIRRKLEEDRR